MDFEERIIRNAILFLVGFGVFTLLGIELRLESIAKSLKILASPPQIEERF